MAARANLELIEELHQAVRDLDFDRYGQLLTEDATFRSAGVPAALGGLLSGREAIVDQLRQTADLRRFEVKQMFGDDEHVCLVRKVSAGHYPGSQHLRGADVPYSTYECVVYRIANGKIAESTAYINWLDPYVQLGLVDIRPLTR